METNQEIRCPSCGGLAAHHNLGPISLAVCADCGGIWFGSGQLKHLIAQGPSVLDDIMGFEPAQPSGREISTLKCPECHIPLHTNQLGGAKNVPISTCYGCGGLFLDSAAFKLLDTELHEGTYIPSGISPEALAAGATVTSMTIADQARTAYMYDILSSRQFGRGAYGPAFRI